MEITVSARVLPGGKYEIRTNSDRVDVAANHIELEEALHAKGIAGTTCAAFLRSLAEKGEAEITLPVGKFFQP